MTEDTSSMKELGSSGPAGLTCSASSLTRQRGVRHLRQADRGGTGLHSGSKAPAQISNLPISLWGGMGRDVGSGTGTHMAVGLACLRSGCNWTKLSFGKYFRGAG